MIPITLIFRIIDQGSSNIYSKIILILPKVFVLFEVFEKSKVVPKKLYLFQLLQVTPSKSIFNTICLSKNINSRSNFRKLRLLYILKKVLENVIHVFVILIPHVTIFSSCVFFVYLKKSLQDVITESNFFMQDFSQKRKINEFFLTTMTLLIKTKHFGT